MFDRWRRLGPIIGLLCAGLLSAAFVLSASSARAGLAITEVMYKPLAGETFTWVEVYNAGTGDAILDNLFLEDENGNGAWFVETLPLTGNVTLAQGRFAILLDISSNPGNPAAVIAKFEDNWNVFGNPMILGVNPGLGNPLLGQAIDSDINIVDYTGPPTVLDTLSDFRSLTSVEPVSGQSIFWENTQNLNDTPVWAVATNGILGSTGTGTSSGGGEGGFGSPGFFNNAVVPEPSSLAIFLSIGLLGLSRPRRRDRNL